MKEIMMRSRFSVGVGIFLLCFGARVDAPGPINQALAAGSATAAPIAVAPGISPPPPLVPTTVMPGTVNLDKVYKSERTAKGKQALKNKDREKFGLGERDAGVESHKGHVRQKNVKAN